MKAHKHIKRFMFLCLVMAYIQPLKAQVVISNEEEFPGSIANGAMLQIQASDAGLLVPFVTLDLDGFGDVYAPKLTVEPADGLIIYHDGSNSISKGFWYYDADIPAWVLYSDWASAFSIDLNNYGEIDESNKPGTGTPYTLTNLYFIPWKSASAGLIGPEFQFLDDVTVNTETGTAVSDQLEVIGNDAVYSINVSIAVVSSTPGNEITGQLYINDNPVNHIFFRHTFQNKNAPTSCFTSGLIELSTNDKVDFRFSTTTAIEGIELELLNLRLTKVGEL